MTAGRIVVAATIQKTIFDVIFAKARAVGMNAWEDVMRMGNTRR